jgi:hypothetical protein
MTLNIAPSAIETVDIRVPAGNIRNFTSFSGSFIHYPSSRCVSAVNAVCQSRDIFRNWNTSKLNRSFDFVLCLFSLCVVVAADSDRADSAI